MHSAVNYFCQVPNESNCVPNSPPINHEGTFSSAVGMQNCVLSCDTSHSDGGSKLDETQCSLLISLEVDIQPSSLECDVLTSECSQPLWTPEPTQPGVNISVNDVEPILLSSLSIGTEEFAQDMSNTNVSNYEQSNELLSGRFLDVEQLCEVLQGHPVTGSSIPKGLKENTYFVITNENNMDKRNRGMRSNFEDDCGIWQTKSSSTKTTLFYHNVKN